MAKRSPKLTPSQPQKRSGLASQTKRSPRPIKTNVLVAPHLPLDQDFEPDLTELPSRPKTNVLVSPELRPGRRIRNALITTGMLLGMASLVASGGWLAVQLIVNPGSVSWLRWMLPEWNRVALSGADTPRTLAEIQAELAQSELFLGEFLPLNAGTNLDDSTDFNDLVAPVLSQDRCRGSGAIAANSPPDCAEIIELRVYRPQLSQPPQRSSDGATAYQLVDRLAVTGPDEFFVTAPLLRSSAATPGSNRPQPLDSVSLVEGDAAESGFWLHLSGEWVRGSNRVVYGQIVRYDPSQNRLYSLMPWTSPARQFPRWQQVTGDESTELVVNQTVGLEPQFKVYQVRAVPSIVDPMQMEAISLTEPVLDSRAYENGLILARHGLWSPALQTLQTVKQQSTDWSAAAQAQLDLIALHAQVTKAQTERAWASPGQQLLAHLIDGRWGRGLQLLQAALENGYELTSLLQNDSDRMWRRVGAALRANPNQPDVQAWGALIVHSQRGRDAAIAWLREQNGTAASQGTVSTVPIDSRVERILNLLDAPQTTTAATTHPSRILGSVTQLARINPADWLQLPNVSLTGEQQWYQVSVASFHDGQRWRRSPFTDLNLPATGTAQRLWQLLGMANDAQIQIIDWTAEAQPQILPATVRAVQIRNGVLHLLAAGDAETPLTDSSPLRPLAMTTATLPWVEPIGTLTLAELSQQAGWTAMIPVLWQELQQADQVVSVSTADPAEMLQQLGHWSVQLIDLTGDRHPEAVLTFQASSTENFTDVAASQNSNTSTRPRTLIFSDQGALLYNELGREADQSLAAIADSGDGVALIVDGSQNYSLQRWSTQNQRFE